MTHTEANHLNEQLARRSRSETVSGSNPLQPESIVVHYHEIALKGNNRDYFEKRLQKNIQRATAHLGVQAIVRL